MLKKTINIYNKASLLTLVRTINIDKSVLRSRPTPEKPASGRLFTQDIFLGWFLRMGSDKETDNLTDRKAHKKKTKKKQRQRVLDELEAENCCFV